MTNPTYPLVSFGLDDTNIKNKISSVTDVYGYLTFHQSFCNLDDLQTGLKTVVPYATFEPDYWVLDGNHHFMPASPVIGTMANALSDGTTRMVPGFFVTSIFFSSTQSIRYLALFFDVANNEWCDSVKIDFWTAGAVNLFSTTITPSSPIYNLDCGSIISGVDHVNIQLTRTNKVYRFARLTAIDFGTTGTVTHLDRTKIKSAKIVEEVSPISATNTMNTFEMDLVLDSNEFNVTNPSSPYNLPQKMPFTVYEVVDNVTNSMGTFYLDKWENLNKWSIRFTCYDAMYILDKIPFYGWIGTANISDLISYILTGSNIGYTVDVNQSVIGYIAPGSARDALQQIAFASQLTIQCARSSKVNFKDINLSTYDLGAMDYTFTLADENIDDVHLTNLVTGIKFINPKLADAGGAYNIIYVHNSMPVGDYVIPLTTTNFSLNSGNGSVVPHGAIILTGCTFNTPVGWDTTGSFYAKIHVASITNVNIQSTGMMNASVADPVIYDSGTSPSTFVETTSTLFWNSVAPHFSDYTQWLKTYYINMRYMQKSTVYSSLVGSGNIIQIATWDLHNIVAIVEKAEIELVGLRTDIEVLGVLI